MPDPRTNPAPASRMNPRRVEWIAVVGLAVQAFAALGLGVLSMYAGGRGLGILAFFALIGVFFWGVAWLHLRLRRLAEEEADQLVLAERQRRMAGMERLFDGDDDAGQAERNLGQMDRFLAPAASVLFALALLALPASYFLRDSTPWRAVATAVLIEKSSALVAAAVAAGLAVALFLCGMYASGLARERGREVIRAGGGFMLVTALFSLLAAMALGLGGQQWSLAWPDQAVSGLLLAWAALQGVEILVNLVLNVYRPRVPGVASRPAYDSRLSGLFAEPTGLLRTFAHTLDYQFGFKISETWVFHFLERAFAPLVLIWLCTFYLMTSMVVVRPGEAAIIERFGAPRGVVLPVATGDEAADEAAWDRLAVAPKGPGLHFKYPWPIETVRVFPRARIQHIFSAGGHDDAHAHAAPEYVDDGHGHTPPPPPREASMDKMSILSWSDEGHGNEVAYLMPKPDIMVDPMFSGFLLEGETAPETPAAADRPAAPAPERRPLAPLATLQTRRRAGGQAAPVDAMLLSGTFSLQYRVGGRPGDLYRFTYRHADPVGELKAKFEQELTVMMAGSEFWSLLRVGNRDVQTRLRATLAPAAARHGIEIIDVQLQSVHPPAGDVGKAFQEVLSAWQSIKAAQYRGLRDEYAALGAVEGRREATLAAAENRAYQRRVIAKADADLFVRRLATFRVAPEVYVEHLRLRALGDLFGRARLIVHPRGAQVRVDGSRELTGNAATLLGGVGGAIARERENQ